MKTILLVLVMLVPFTKNYAIEAKKVLIMGDSHTVGPFGAQLDKLIRNDGHEVMTIGSCGAVAAWYFLGTVTPCGFYQNTVQGVTTRLPKAPTPMIAAVLDEMKPDFVIVELSGNYLKRSDEFTLKDMQKFQDLIDLKVGLRRCIWSGVPSARNPEGTDRLYQLLHKAIGNRCSIVNATEVTQYPSTGGDGVHYSGELGRVQTLKWAVSVKTQFDKDALSN